MSYYWDRKQKFDKWGKIREAYPEEGAMPLYLHGIYLSGDPKTREYVLEKYKARPYKRSKHEKQLKNKVLKDVLLVKVYHNIYTKYGSTLLKLRDLDKKNT